MARGATTSFKNANVHGSGGYLCLALFQLSDISSTFLRGSWTFSFSPGWAEQAGGSGTALHWEGEMVHWGSLKIKVASLFELITHLGTYWEFCLHFNTVCLVWLITLKRYWGAGQQPSHQGLQHIAHILPCMLKFIRYHSIYICIHSTQSVRDWSSGVINSLYVLLYWTTSARPPLALLCNIWLPHHPMSLYWVINVFPPLLQPYNPLFMWKDGDLVLLSIFKIIVWSRAAGPTLMPQGPHQSWFT